ncbi:MAG: hypothetical protein AB7R89_13525 [Dehalococcoidia bacterium]
MRAMAIRQVDASPSGASALIHLEDDNGDHLATVPVDDATGQAILATLIGRPSAHAAAFDALEAALQVFGGYASCVVIAERHGRLCGTLQINARFRSTTLELPAAQALLAATRLHLPILMHECDIASHTVRADVPPVFRTLLASLDLSGLESEGH